MTVVLALLFGLIWGSFLNVCIYRIPRDISVVAPRSFCPECGGQIAALDNIPLFSFFALRGKCRLCNQSVSWRYPLVELSTAILSALIIYRYGLTVVGLKWLVFESIMVVLFCTDLEERILPDEFTVGGLIPALLFSLLTQVQSPLLDLFLGGVSPIPRSLLKMLVSVVILVGPIWAVAALYSRFRHRDGLGLGDIKLLALMGAFLGLENGLFAMLIASLGGSLFGIFLIGKHRKAALHFELPFGSFLCAGAGLIPLWKQTS